MSSRSFDTYKIVLYRQDDRAWVAEIPAISGCYALMSTREEALAELAHVCAGLPARVESARRSEERRVGKECRL